MQDLIGKRLGQYEIKEKIGQGGMAQVFKAYQPFLDRYVAVKVLPPLLAQQKGFTQRFQREARSAASLHHPNIIQVFDYGIVDQYTYLVMRYVENSQTLDELISNKISLASLLEHLIQVADALDYAHKRDIIHRDVKPSNIMIDNQWALLTDFGLVRIGEDSSDLTRTGFSMGTPAYMSPEQALGINIDHRTDIYALGVILYRILTDTIPHNATTPQAILTKRTINPVTPPRELNPTVPERLNQITIKTLEMKPDHRYASAANFAASLRVAAQETDRVNEWISTVRLEKPKETVVLDSVSTDNSDSEASVAGHLQNINSTVKPKRNHWIGIGALALIGVVIILAFFNFFNNTAPSAAEISAATNEAEEASPATRPTATVTVAFTEEVEIVQTPRALAKAQVEIRSGPGDVYDIIGFLPEGAQVDIVSRDQSGDWWRIRTDISSNGGWVRSSSDYTEARGITNLPISIAPATPTLTTLTILPTTNIPTPTDTPEPPRATATSTSEPNTATPTPTSATATVRPILPTATPQPELPQGQLVLVRPNEQDGSTSGLTEFVWQWSSTLEPDQGFEVRVWRDGEPPAGIHNAVEDNQSGEIISLGNNTYGLTANITDVPSVSGRGGDYLWTVVLINIEPEYRDLGIQASPGHLRLDLGGSSGGDGPGGVVLP